MKTFIRIISLYVISLFLSVNIFSTSTVISMETPTTPNDSTTITLFDALWKGDISTAKKMIDEGADVNTIDPRNYYTPLMIIVRDSVNIEFAKYLIDKGADVNYANTSGESILHVAVAKVSVRMIKLLVEHGVDIHAIYEGGGGITPVFAAAGAGNMNVVKYLEGLGADVNFKSKYGTTSIRAAAMRGHFEMFKYLGQKQPKEFDWNNALYYGVFAGSLDIARYAIEKGAKVNVKSPESGTYPIEEAARNTIKNYKNETKNVELIQYLVSKGARLKDINGGEIFPWAMRHSDEGTIGYFLEQGIEFNDLPEELGWTPLTAALDNSNFTLAKHLLTKGNYDSNFTGKLLVFFGDGLYNSHQIIDLLINEGADKSFYPQAFLKSARLNDLESIKVLLTAGTAINVKNSDGNNALALTSDSTLAKYLIEEGIDTADKQLLEHAWQNFPVLTVLLNNEVAVPVSIENANKGLWTAAKLGDLFLLHFFLSKGADVNYKNPNYDNQTALMANAKQGYAQCSYNYAQEVQISPEIAQVLIAGGADVNARDDRGKTALHYAADDQWCQAGNFGPIPMGNRQERQQGFHGDPATPPLQCHDLIVEVLIEAGSIVNLIDNDKNTPFFLSQINKNAKTQALLEKAGASY